MTTSLLVSGALRASIVLALGLLASTALSRASAATRRAVLVVALGASLVVPLASVVGPSWRVEAPALLPTFAHESALEGTAVPGHASEATPLQPSSPGSMAPHFNGATLVFALWLGGVALVLARAIASVLRARALVARSAPAAGDAWREVTARALRDAGVDADVRLSGELESPAVTGILHSTVLFPVSAAAWPDERKRVVLVHELAHVRGRDGLAQVVADAACAVSWFNPLAWMCAKRLRVERELAADDAVLAAGVRPSHYAEELLTLAGGETLGAFAMAERSSLGDRVVAILAAKRARSPLAARGTTLLVATSVAVGAAVACTSPEAPALTPSAGAASAGAPSAGKSIDARIQGAADEELTRLVKEAAGEAATIVVLDPATGEILANAGQKEGKPFDVAEAQPMSPGSTLKAITFAAALETGAIKPDQVFECGPKPRHYAEGDLHDSAEHGSLDLAHVLAVSSNIGTSRVFDALGGDKLGDWLGRFHLEAPATIATGTLAGAEVATGERMSATPLQMAAAYAALANDGVYHAPTTEQTAAPKERLVSSTTAHEIMAMLDVVVSAPEGTGASARVDGVHVSGKTGTSVWTAPDGHDHTYASFVGVADLPARRIVALVGVETLRDGVWGGRYPAETFARLVGSLR